MLAGVAMYSTVILLLGSFVLTATSVYAFMRAHYCACHQQGECDNPIEKYWLVSIVCAAVSLAMSCAALGVDRGSLLWLVLALSCLVGALLSAHKQKLRKRQCATAPTDESLTNDPY